MNVNVLLNNKMTYLSDVHQIEMKEDISIQKDSLELIKNTDIPVNYNKLINIPINVIKQFAIIMSREYEMRAYINTFEPFVVTIYPQCLGKYLEPVDYIGIMTNSMNFCKNSVNIFINEEIKVKVWRNNEFINLNYSLSKDYCKFIFTDWNYNFKIEEFILKNLKNLKMSLNPSEFYDKRYREQYFDVFID